MEIFLCCKIAKRLEIHSVIAAFITLALDKSRLAKLLNTHCPKRIKFDWMNYYASFGFQVIATCR